MIFHQRVSFNINIEIYISNLLTEFSVAFKLYSSYIANYQIVYEAINNQQKKNNKFAKLLNTVKEDLIKENYRINDIFSFMILPVKTH
jgi:hypothetical protein